MLSVETIGDEAIWAITNPITGDERASVDVTLEAFYVLRDHAGTDFDGLVGRLADRGVHVIEADSERFELRDSAAM